MRQSPVGVLSRIMLFDEAESTVLMGFPLPLPDALYEAVT
jgi:hypothetical protein